MGLWFKDPELEAGERVVRTKAANRFQGSRGVGGKLALTDRRLVFTPHHVDALLVGKRWAVALDEVRTVGIEPRGSANKGLLGGGLANRLRVRTRAGGEELFAVKGVEELLDQLTDAGLAREPASEAGAVKPLGD